jgi:hypothetical protein
VDSGQHTGRTDLPLTGRGERIARRARPQAWILVARWLDLPAADGRVLLLPPAMLGITGSEHEHPVLSRWGA